MSYNYNEDSIKTLEALEGIRKKLPMYVGSRDNQAIHHIIKEIISNSIDEYLSGFGKLIEVVLYPETNSISIEDEGRGIPVGKLESSFLTPHTSGKFEGAGAYGASGGLNGIGLKTATATGKNEVIITTEKEIYEQEFSFKDGASALIKKPNKTKRRTGTYIKWTPEAEPFMGDNKISLEKVTSLLEDLSYVVPGLKFSIKEEGKEPRIIVSKGLDDFLKDYVGSHDMISPIINVKASNTDIMVECALVWAKKSSLEQSYVNLIPTNDGGTHVTALKATLTREINKAFDKDFKGEEIRKGLNFILSVKMRYEPEFKGQSKDALNMPSVNAPISALLREELVEAIQKEKKFFDKFVAILEEIRKKSNVDSLLKKLTSGKKKEGGLSDVTKKYKGCSATSDIELFITEGQSAAGGLNLSKSSVNQATYALRGKILNTFDKDLEKILENEEIKGLIEILGSEKEALKKFNKIVITSDADVDGSNIRVLVLGFIAKFYPKLLTEGKIYVPILPLYSATDSKGEKHFYMNEEEVRKVPKSWDISYLKGLGEMNPPELGRFTVIEKTRKLMKIEVSEDDFNDFYSTLELALSKEKESVELRKELLI